MRNLIHQTLIVVLITCLGITESHDPEDSVHCEAPMNAKGEWTQPVCRPVVERRLPARLREGAPRRGVDPNAGWGRHGPPREDGRRGLGRQLRLSN